MNREYSINLFNKILFFVLAAFFSVVAIYLLAKPIAAGVSHAVLLIPVLLLALAVFIVLGVFKRKIIVDDNSITRYHIFGSNTLAFDQIKGYRAGNKATSIIPLSPSNSNISISNSDYADGDDLIAFFKERFTDLDAIDLKEEEERLMSDTSLGATTDDREATLKRAKLIALIGNIAGGAVAIATFFKHDKLLSLYLPAIYPILMVVVIATSKGLIKIVPEGKKSQLPALIFGLLFPIMMLFISAIASYNLVELKNYWLPFLGIMLAFGILLLAAGLKNNAGAIALAIVISIIVSAGYSAGLTTKINCQLDDSKPQTFQTTIMRKYTTSGKGAHYHIVLAPWWQNQSSKEVDISLHSYNLVDVGSPVNIYQRPGKLNVPWFDFDLMITPPAPAGSNNGNYPIPK